MSQLPPVASRHESLSLIAVVFLEVRDGIRSSAEAAKIKYGLEALPGVTAVRFPGERVAVSFHPGIVSQESLEQALAAEGILVAVTPAPDA